MERGVGTMNTISVVSVDIIEHEGETYERSAGGTWYVVMGESTETVTDSVEKELEALYQHLNDPRVCRGPEVTVVCERCQSQIASWTAKYEAAQKRLNEETLKMQRQIDELNRDKNRLQRSLNDALHNIREAIVALRGDIDD